MRKLVISIFRLLFLILSVLLGFFLVKTWKANKPNLKPQLEKIKERIAKRVGEKKQEDKGSLKEVGVKFNEKEFTARQKIILTIIRSKKTVEMRDLLKAISGVTERTLRRDLSVLQEKGFIKKEGTTKSVKYHLESD
jgi:predicted HTH transcriptional regulator